MSDNAQVGTDQRNTVAPPQTGPQGEAEAVSFPSESFPDTLKDFASRQGDGSFLYPGGVFFSLTVSPAVEKIYVVIPDRNMPEAPAREVLLQKIEEKKWVADVPGLEAGQLYAFRVIPAGRSENDPVVLLPDLYAHGMRQDSSGQIWSVVMPQLDCERRTGPLVELSAADTVIYETHVKSFTRMMGAVPAQERGTYSAMGGEQSIAYLTDLGVNAVELLPVHFHADEPSVKARGLSNLWGYNSASFLAVHPYSLSGDPVQVRTEVIAMLENLAAARIGVIADVVYGHTAEGAVTGPRSGLTLGWRQMHPGMYRTDGNGRDIDYSGCGNTININNAFAADHVMESLRNLWQTYGFSGFRFDQASILGRQPEGHFDGNHPFLHRVAEDPRIGRDGSWIIAEPWDCHSDPHDSYALAKFPERWKQWNGRFRDDVIACLCHGCTPGLLAHRLYGSSDLFRSPQCSINYVTCHDEATLLDLFTYQIPRNEANQEDNGHRSNRGWNCGHEGPSDDPEVNRLRIKMCRNVMAILLLSRGIPMINGGDEFLRTQQGNSNAWCQDNEISWYNWKWNAAQKEFFQFVKDLIDLRRSEPAFTRTEFAPHHAPDVLWYHRSGHLMNTGDWSNNTERGLCVHWLGRDSGGKTGDGRPLDGSDMLFLVNPHSTPREFVLPPVADRPGKWVRLFDTDLDRPFADNSGLEPGNRYPAAPRSTAAFRFVSASAAGHEQMADVD